MRLFRVYNSTRSDRSGPSAGSGRRSTPGVDSVGTEARRFPVATARLRLLIWSAAVLGVLVPAVSFAQQSGTNSGAAVGRTGIQLVQSRSQRVTADDTKPKAPLPYEISEMPDVQEDMEIIHRRSQLIVARSPVARISIADPSVIDVVQYSPNEFSVIGLMLGTTTLTLWFDSSREPLIYLVEVIPDPTWEERLRADFGKLEKQLRILFPNSKVYLIPLQQRLIVKGQARDNEDAARILQIVRSAYYAEFGAFGAFGNGGYGGYGGGFGGPGGFGNNNNNNNNGDDDNDEDDFIVNLLEVPGNHQIMLHVKIAEISRAQLRQFGLRLGGTINDRHQLGVNLLRAGSATGVGGAALSAGSVLTGVFENGELTVALNWLAGNRTARILAAPTLTVLSGHTASFLAGGEFPVPTIVGVGGAQGSTTSFRGFGTSLLVRPEVIDKDWIKMDITPEYSQINAANGAGGIPGLSSRRVNTTVQLREGQTIVLAGLFGSTMTQEVDRVPFLGELPFIGPILFNAKKADHGENELLIVVTPELVRPMEPDEVPPLPGFYMTPPNDFELYKYAKTEGYPDQGVYQLSPYGWGPGYAEEIGYRPFNPASYGSPAPLATGGFSAGAMGGMSYPQQPAPIYPAPPMAQDPSGMAGGGAAYPAPAYGQAPNYGQAPAAAYPQMAPVPAAIQPTPDPGVNGAAPVQQMGAIQQVGYEQPQGNGSGMLNWMRGRGSSAAPPQQAVNPAMLRTNATSPSLENGIDGRLNANGQSGQRRTAGRRGLYQ
ncbi:type II and III secretion system protein [bacterium]|nr:type II and III secretion system protein [bacterium]